MSSEAAVLCCCRQHARRDNSRGHMYVRSIALAAALVASTAGQAQSFTGAELRQELQLMSLVGSGKASSKDYARIGHVVGYISGFSDAYLQEQVRGAKFAQDRFTFCLPKEFTVEGLQRVTTSCLERHTEPFLDAAPAGAVLARAFREAFPCLKQ